LDEAGSGPGEDHLEGAGVGGPSEDVVGLVELVEGEVVGHEALGVDLVALGQLEERGGGVGVDEAGGDGDVADPKVLEVQGDRLAVDPDVGDVAAGAPPRRGPRQIRSTR
jgi:hypothetical protein